MADGAGGVLFLPSVLRTMITARPGRCGRASTREAGQDTSSAIAVTVALNRRPVAIDALVVELPRIVDRCSVVNESGNGSGKNHPVDSAASASTAIGVATTTTAVSGATSRPSRARCGTLMRPPVRRARVVSYHAPTSAW